MQSVASVQKTWMTTEFDYELNGLTLGTILTNHRGNHKAVRNPRSLTSIKRRTWNKAGPAVNSLSDNIFRPTLAPCNRTRLAMPLWRMFHSSAARVWLRIRRSALSSRHRGGGLARVSPIAGQDQIKDGIEPATGPRRKPCPFWYLGEAVTRLRLIYVPTAQLDRNSNPRHARVMLQPNTSYQSWERRRSGRSCIERGKEL